MVCAHLRLVPLSTLLVACLAPRGPTDPGGSTGHADLDADPAAYSATVALSQLDVALDALDLPNSPWGAATVTFSGVTGVLYFNLVLDGQWRIQNMPVLSREGLVSQAADFNFDLGVTAGTDVALATAAWDLTDAPLASAPTLPGTQVSVASAGYAISTGTAGKTILYSPPEPNLVGGAADGPKAAHSGFPNQQSGVNECAPVALSNSLTWMNDRYGLGLAAADISIASLKGTVGWGPGGAGQQWWTKKRTRFKEVLETSTIPRFSFDQVAEGIQNGCDIEIRANNHVVAITGIQRLADGRYSVDLTHDTDQKDNTKGTKTETVTWDPKAKVFKGAPWIDGHSADLIVKECPKRRT